MRLGCDVCVCVRVGVSVCVCLRDCSAGEWSVLSEWVGAGVLAWEEKGEGDDEEEAAAAAEEE